MAKPISKFIFPVIRKDKEGNRYFILKGKRIIIPKKLTKAELKQFIIKERAKAKKIRIVRRVKPKPVAKVEDEVKPKEPKKERVGRIRAPPATKSSRIAQALEDADIRERIKEKIWCYKRNIYKN